MKTLLVATTSYNNLTTRGEPTLSRMIASVREARTVLARSGLARVRWSWVDDGSTDGTAEWLRAHLRPGDDEMLTLSETNNWLAVARNLAVTPFRSDFVNVFDSDDEALPDHFVTGIRALETPDAAGLRAGVARTTTDFGDAASIHPDWIAGISSIQVNTAFYRREVWDFVEGMPTLGIYRVTGCEDQDLAAIVRAFFDVHQSPTVTARYWRYDDSNFDRQLGKFRRAYADAPTYDIEAPDLVAHHQLRIRFTHDRIRDLKQKLSLSTDVGQFAGLRKGPAFTELGLNY